MSPYKLKPSPTPSQAQSSSEGCNCGCFEAGFYSGQQSFSLLKGGMCLECGRLLKEGVASNVVFRDLRVFFFPSTERQQTIYSWLFIASDSWIWVRRPAGQTGKLTASIWSGKQGVESLGLAAEWGGAADTVGGTYDAANAHCIEAQPASRLMPNTHSMEEVQVFKTKNVHA